MHDKYTAENRLIIDCLALMREDQIYDPEELFNLLKGRYRVHYSKVRRAIDFAKGI